MTLFSPRTTPVGRLVLLPVLPFDSHPLHPSRPVRPSSISWVPRPRPAGGVTSFGPGSPSEGTTWFKEDFPRLPYLPWTPGLPERTETPFLVHGSVGDFYDLHPLRVPTETVCHRPLSVISNCPRRDRRLPLDVPLMKTRGPVCESL